MEIIFDNGLYVEDPEDVEKLSRDFFGDLDGKKIKLLPEEALYLISFRNATAKDRVNSSRYLHEQNPC